jgi:hypothetical protein
VHVNAVAKTAAFVRRAASPLAHGGIKNRSRDAIRARGFAANNNTSSPPGLTRWSMPSRGSEKPRIIDAARPHGLPGQARQ